MLCSLWYVVSYMSASPTVMSTDGTGSLSIGQFYGPVAFQVMSHTRTGEYLITH